MVAVRIGNEAIIRTLAHSDVQVKIGMRNRVMPLVRIFRMVTKKLMPVSVVPIPDICSAHIQ